MPEGAREPSLRRATVPLLALLSALLMILSEQPAVAKTGEPDPSTNPVSRSFADAFADPTIIHAKDGWWYAYSTADPLKSGKESGNMHIARTKDFASWHYQGTVFDDSNRPSWATSTSNLWAPDIRYIEGRYVLYFTVTDTSLNAGEDSAIGVATSTTPAGPWNATDAPVIAPRPEGGDEDFLWTFDPAGFTDIRGKRYLYFGSYAGGLWVSRMSKNGLTTVGRATQVAIENRYEGAYVVRHGAWYYLMGSSANCCAGPATGYSVFSGRAKSPLGPFIDADGIPLLTSRAGGTLMITQNGNRWIGAGHHAITTDNAGRDFIVYHAIDRNKPWLDEPFGTNRRPMLMDRIDWIDGWPRTRAGAGPSDSIQPRPVTGSDYGISAGDAANGGFDHLVAGPIDPQSGRTGRLRGTAHTATDIHGASVRLRLDVKGRHPVKVSLGTRCAGSAVTVDTERGRLVIKSTHGRTTRTRIARFAPVARAWRTLVVEVNGSKLMAQLSESDLNDPLAEVRLKSAASLGHAPIRLFSSHALIDNVSIRKLAVDARRTVGVPRRGKLLTSEPFTTPLSAKWTWVRKNDNVTVSGHGLNWPLESADLVDSAELEDISNNDTAGVLLRDTPAGTWIAQTKLTLDLGTNDERNFQQAGLIAYDNDDNFARLSSVAIWNTRQIEFGRELVASADGKTSYGGAVVGTPATTVWLRLAHTRNASGEHLYRAATSRDRKTWTWGAVWTFGAAAKPRIGLVAHGGATAPVAARFGYLRFYAARWSGSMK